MLIRLLAFAILIYLSWYNVSLFILISWIPLFKILNSDLSKVKIIASTFLLFVTYNLVVTYWLVEWDTLKGISVLALNSLLMESAVVLSLFLNKHKSALRNLTFIITWLAFEYIHHIWAFTWPWLTLGNTFSIQPIFVQWYQFTGVLGGSFWVLISNLSFYEQIKKGKFKITSALIVLVPIALSITMYFGDDIVSKRTNCIRVGVMLTNFSSDEYVSDSIKLALVNEEILKKDPKNLKYMLFPETFFKENIWADGFAFSKLYKELQSLSKATHTKIMSGYFLNREEEDGIYQQGNGLFKFNQYNSVIQIDTSISIPIKLKKVFIPIQEYTPSYLQIFDIHGYTNFKLLSGNKDYFKDEGQKIFMSICYESVNGIFFSDRWTDENLIFMIASEAFLRGNSIAMQQYQNICRLRAIEFSKFLFKSSNAGISSVIDERGEVVNFKRASKSVELLSYVGHTNNVKTFYSTWGWLTNKLPVFVLAILILFIIFLPVIGSKSKFVA